jgi:RNA polymerase sporulation-specific sigma factor
MQVKETDPDEGMIYVEEMRELMQKMSRVLSNLEFRIFTMYMNGVSVSEISETTGRNIKSVDNALQRSKNKLLKMMEQENK